MDETDLKIIGYLLVDSRQRFADIAKELGVSKNAVWNRYQQLCEKKIITGSTININYMALGYECVAAVRFDVYPSKIDAIIEILKNIPDVFGPFESPSRYNLRVVVVIKSMKQLINLKETLGRNASIREIDYAFWTDVWLSFKNLSLIPVQPMTLSKKETNPSSPVSSLKFQKDLDELDEKLISELMKDSRISFRQLAQRFDVSVDTVSRRYEKLREDKIIAARIQIDPDKIGYHAIANYYLKIEPDFNLAEIVSKLTSLPDVYYAMKCVGQYNIGVMQMAKGVEDILQTGSAMERIPGVERLETLICRTGDKWPIARTYASTIN